MENCDRENIDKLLEIRQIHQYFPRQSFVPYGGYILGKKFLIEADPKPLVPLLGNKSLHSLPLRILHFQLRLARYEYEIFHIPGKSLVMADTLSHSPSNPQTVMFTVLQEGVEYLMEMCINNLPASSQHLCSSFMRLKRQTPSAQPSSLIAKMSGPRNRTYLYSYIKPYWQARGRLTVHDNLLLYIQRMVVPASLQQKILLIIHEGHQGIQTCRLRANISIWWPVISKHIKDLIEQCPTCVKEYSPHKEPLIPTDLQITLGRR